MMRPPPTHPQRPTHTHPFHPPPSPKNPFFSGFATWLLLLFLVLSKTAEEFLVPAVQYSAARLRLPPDIAGGLQGQAGGSREAPRAPPASRRPPAPATPTPRHHALCGGGRSTGFLHATGCAGGGAARGSGAGGCCHIWCACHCYRRHRCPMAPPAARRCRRRGRPWLPPTMQPFHPPPANRLQSLRRCCGVCCCGAVGAGAGGSGQAGIRPRCAAPPRPRPRPQCARPHPRAR